MSTLFPQWQMHQSNPQALRAYVQSRMIEMADEGSLYLTDCLNQPEPLKTYVGDCVLGYGVDPTDRTQTREEIPQELLQYRVRIRAIDHLKQEDEEVSIGVYRSKYVKAKGPIVFKAGSQRVADTVDRETARRLGFSVYTEGDSGWVPKIINTGKDVVDMSLQRAIFCLKEQGKGVKHANSRRLQRLYWKCEEVRPEEYRSDEDGEQGEGKEAPRRRGRPAKSQAESTHVG